MALTVIWQTIGVEFSFHGFVTDVDLLQMNDRFYRDPRCLDMRYRLCDFSAINGAEKHHHIVQLMADTDKTATLNMPRQWIALILPAHLDSGIHQLAQRYCDAMADSGWSVGVFETRGQARDWLRAALPTYSSQIP